MPPLLPYPDLLTQARQFIAAYEELRARFADFAKHAAALNKQGPIRAVAVESGPTTEQFDVLYLGRRFRFQLIAHADDKDNVMGLVRCSEVLPTLIIPVHDFTIDQNGDTNVKPPDTPEPIACYFREGACYLLLNAVHEGL